jgi:hypothetical protein
MVLARKILSWSGLPLARQRRPPKGGGARKVDDLVERFLQAIQAA